MGAELESELEKFSANVIKLLIKDDVLPTPNNFQIYFEKYLETKPIGFRKDVNEIIESENNTDAEHQIKMEADIKDGFLHVKGAMQQVAGVYKNLNVMKNIVKKRQEELSVSSGQFAVNNVISALDDDLKKLADLMTKQMNTIKTHYEKAGTTVKDVESRAVFDSRFGLYNRRYLLQIMQNEIRAVTQFNHQSTMLFLKMKDYIVKNISNQKERIIIMRNIAKLLLKTSRRSDTVAYYGEGLFAMLMKHTDMEHSEAACQRISDLIYSSSFFIGGNEVDVDLEMIAVPIHTKLSTEDTIAHALEVLPETGKDTVLFKVSNPIHDEPMEDEE